MFRGTVDRAGSREGKKTSLRKTNKAKVDAKSGGSSSHKEGSLVSSPPVTLIVPTNKNKAIIDCGCNLVNRQFDSDQQRVIQRAVTSNVSSVIIIPNDYEKTQSAISLCKYHAGVCYVATGLHPNNITSKKLSDKQYTVLISELKQVLCSPEVVAVAIGLDYGRDYGLRFPQERFLKSQVELAVEVDLPIIFHESGATDVLLELLNEARETLPKKSMIFNFKGTKTQLDAFLDLGFYIGMTGVICDSNLGPFFQSQILPHIPHSKILVCSNAPFDTPQNISDAYIRESKNEPSNLTYVIEIIANVWKVSLDEVCLQIRQNAKEFYGLRDIDDPKEKKEDENENEDEEKETEKEKEKEKETPVKGPSPRRTTETSLSEGVKQIEIQTASESTTLEIESQNSTQYACKMCRTKLFQSSDIVPHTSVGEVKIGFGKGKGKDKEKISDDVCTMYFTKYLPWMKNVPKILLDSESHSTIQPTIEHDHKQNISERDTSQDSDSEDDELLEGEGRLECPKCDQKLGRWSNLGIQCSCGVLVPPIAFKVLKSRLDILGGTAKDDFDSEEEEDDDKKGKKEKKKFTKERRKERKTNFRNKDFVI